MGQKPLIMYGVGDIAPYRQDLSSSFLHVKQLFQNGDLTFGQLECVLSETGPLSSCTRMGCSSRPEVAKVLKEMGVDVISFASNHALDYGRDAFQETLRHLREAGLYVTGAGENEQKAREYPIIDVGGTKVAFLGYCSILPQGFWAEEARPGCNPARGITAYVPVEHDQPETPCRMYSFPHPDDLEKMLEDIRNAKKIADLVVVSMHWGIHFKEGVLAGYQKYYAHFAIDAGADIVLGHHAHILKPIEIYKGKVIFYSLGNFAMEEVTDMLRDIKAKGQDMKTSKSHTEMTAISDAFKTTKRSFPMDSYMTMIAKWIVKDGKIISVGYIPAYLPEDGAPYVVKPEDPMFLQIYEYMKKITADQNLDSEIYHLEGEWIRLI